ncbi:Hypothetical protein PHPALM_38140 [Phytophthora palmivora]|uniref:Uncharacterized protein n=1 Tax=Phytophthora palmivora TaxID=4796 RepID=A0A2P4WVN5_9STRA|nr:Hypothetical protein PHPALM_38140 [Phytophthora palmivora]
MACVTWRSSWIKSIASDALDVQDNVASLSPLPLNRPESDAVPCQVSLHWSPPLRCLQLQLDVQCSARHVELHAEGTRRNLLGEEEQGEVYLGTFRGTRHSSEPQTFTMSPIFKQNDRDCDILKSLQTLRLKFVSLTGDKNVLTLQKLQCMAGLGLGAGAGLDVQTILKGFQQTLEREMETKIAQVIDAKLSTLSQRLAFSEQALYQLHKKMDAKDAHVQASIVQIQQKFSQLENQLSQFNVKAEQEQVTEEGESKLVGRTHNVDANDMETTEIIAEGDQQTEKL